MDLAIKPLTPARLPDLAALFGQGGDPKRCWCSFFRTRSKDIVAWSADDDRAVLEQAVVDYATEQRAPGLIAYDGEVAVGWTSLGPREDYPRIVHSRVLAPIDDRPVWSIVCFVVGRRARGQGIATALLAAAIDYARDHGATTLEAYPVEPEAGTRMPSANVYRGTMSMFERAGFELAARRRSPGASMSRPIVRLAL